MQAGQKSWLGGAYGCNCLQRKYENKNIMCYPMPRYFGNGKLTCDRDFV